MPDPKIPVLILAAGVSERMGEPKLLLEFQGNTLIGRAVDLGKNINPGRAAIVLGAYFDEYASAIGGKEINIIRNTSWRDGMGTSIACGLKEIIKQWPDSVGILIMLADQPLMTTEHLNDLILNFSSSGGIITATEYPGSKRGVPAIFPARCFEELRGLTKDKGARDMLNSKEVEVKTVSNPDIVFDIDTQEDFKALRQLNRQS